MLIREEIERIRRECVERGFDDEATTTIVLAVKRGMRVAIHAYAWWRDGDQYCGSQRARDGTWIAPEANPVVVGCGTTTLHRALQEVERA